MNNSLPGFFKLKQVFNAPSISDPAAAARDALAKLPLNKRVRPGMKIAVGAGSRGISNYDVIVRVVCDELKRQGAEVFIVPAMGSHGGATDSGQIEVLSHFGVTEQTMSVPIKSSMETVDLGQAAEFRVYQDRHAATADGIVLINRVKPHTDFHGPVESGLMKMATIGLGKQKGAHQFHQATVRLGHAAALLTIGREVLKRSKILFGIGIVENQLHQTARVAAVPVETMEQEEMRLLEEARLLMPRLPFDDVDLLIVDELGKNISGSGMDTNVIRRDADGSFIKAGSHPVRRIYLRSLHPDSYGNAAGIGMADFIHERLLRAMDPRTTWVNALTALMPANARVPIHFQTDREALEMALQTIGHVEPQTARVLWIKNTLCCERLIASEAFLPETLRRQDLIQESSPAHPAFDAAGDLFPVF